MDAKLLRLVTGLVLALGAPAATAAQDVGAAPRAPDVHFVPTRMEVVRAMLDVTKVGPRDLLYDLGSGDGRIVITAAKRYGARGIGIDIDPVRVRESRQNADTAGVAGRATFRQADLFETDLSKATVVTLYLLPSLNLRLIPKLYKELRPGTRIASNAFDMGDWKADSTLEASDTSGMKSTVFYWLLPADVSGEWTVTADGGRKYQVRFEQKYQQLTGTATVDGQQQSIEQARLRGDRLEFAVQGTRFQGRVRGDKAEGTIGRGSAGQRRWTATRTSKGPGPLPLTPPT